MAAKWLVKLLDNLKQVAPGLIGGAVGTAATSIAGPLGPVVGGVVANLMRKVTGAAADDVDYEEMAEEIMTSPELRLELEKLAIEREKIELEREKARYDMERSRIQADTARIEAVNATMRAESGADDPWTRRWRPYWGFVSGTCWGILALSFALLVVGMATGFGDVTPKDIRAVGTAFADMMVFFGVAGAMVGVTAWGRSQEKKGRLEAVKSTSGMMLP
jgi:hypothetical protein